MKIRQADSVSTKGPEKNLPASPQMPDLKGLYGSGLMEGFEIDTEDLKTHKDMRGFAASTSLSSQAPLTNSTAEEGWMFQELASKGVPYGIPGLYVRPFTVAMLSRVHAAQQAATREGQQKQAFTMLLDALAPTIKDFDIRDLTVPDYYSHMYWLRLNSYPRSPMTVPWTSRYGNENIARITRSTFEFQELEMTRDEFLEWRKRGITFPTIRDMELLTEPTLADDMRWTLTYAQYIYLPGKPDENSAKRKIEMLEEMGPEALSTINEFASKMGHGVIEQIKVKDDKFNLDNAITYVKAEVQQLSKILNAVLDEDQSANTQMGSMLALGNHVEERIAELDMLVKVKENNGLTEDGKRFTPVEEVVVLASANATMLFP